MWGLENAGQDGGLSDADIDAPEAWDLVPGASLAGAWAAGEYTVGVIDTGIDVGHEDLAGKVIGDCYSALGGGGTLSPGCADQNGHGTHASGTIAAIGNNGRGIAGAAPGARILMCKALGADGSGFVSDVVACMNDIVNKRSAYNIRVLSMSIGGGGSATLEAAVNDAWSKGVLIVAAAGNDGNGTVSYPAGYANAVSVAATDRSDARAGFSNANADVEISAPGVGIVSTVPGGYAAYSGTSMAAPHVAAAAALIAWKDGRAGPALRTALDAAVDDLGAAGRDHSFGHGRLNLCKALGGSCAYAPGSSRPSPAAPPAPAADRTAPRVRATLPARVDLRRALRGGIRAACGTNEAARCTLSAELRGAEARRLGLRARGPRSVPIAEATADLSGAGSATLDARLTQVAARAIRGARSVTINVRLTARDRAGNSKSLTRRVRMA
jgi:thermitase